MLIIITIGTVIYKESKNWVISNSITLKPEQTRGEIETHFLNKSSIYLFGDLAHCGIVFSLENEGVSKVHELFRIVVSSEPVLPPC